MFKARYLVLVGFILTAAALRLVPHPPNFTPIAALALFGGAHFSHRWAALGVPLAALLIGDLIIGFHVTMPVVYVSFALVVGLGRWLRPGQGILPVTGAVLAASILFFILTNFGVWVLLSSYPKTLAGLGACYTAALPFFGNTLMGTAFYTAALFGGFALAGRGFPVLVAGELAPPKYS